MSLDLSTEMEAESSIRLPRGGEAADHDKALIALFKLDEALVKPLTSSFRGIRKEDSTLLSLFEINQIFTLPISNHLKRSINTSLADSNNSLFENRTQLSCPGSTIRLTEKTNRKSSLI